MTPGPGSEAAYRVVAVKSENAPSSYRVEKTFAAAPKTLKVAEDGSCEKVLKVFKTEEEANKYSESLRQAAATPAGKKG